MKKSNRKIPAMLLLGVLLLGMSSCEDFVQVDQPTGELVRPAVFEDATTAQAALTHIYARMRDWGMLTGSNQSITTKLAAYSDDLSFYGPPSSATHDFYFNTLLASDPILAGWWKEAYYQVYAANALMEGIAVSQGLTTEQKAEMTGEALFLRAYIHFHLAMVFGDVPYITTTDYRTNSVVARLAHEDVLENALADFERAASLLSENYPDAQRTRVNKYAAWAMVARTRLYAGDWEGAADAASSVINASSLYVWENNIDNVFKKESRTTIWQYMPSQEGINSAEGASFILPFGPPSDVALSTWLLEAFEPGDLRRQNWVGEISGDGQTWYYAFKYKERDMTSNAVEYSIQLRLAEQYLIRAEARARQGELIGASEDLNRIRNAAGLANTTAATQGQILSAILAERRVEFFAEAGHRFFDLKRYGNLDSLNGVKQGWDTSDALMPVPESELLLNPNLLPQNTGY